MGCHENIDFNKFPKQGQYAGKRAKVLFFYRGEHIYGTIVRDDAEEPYRTIIHLDDGRLVLAEECQYSPLREGEDGP